MNDLTSHPLTGAELGRDAALTLHATLWEGAVMAAFHRTEQLCDWQPYRLPGATRIEVTGAWVVTHLAVRNPGGVLLRFPIARAVGTDVVPGDHLDLPPAPWLTSL